MGTDPIYVVIAGGGCVVDGVKWVMVISAILVPVTRFAVITGRRRADGGWVMNIGGGNYRRNSGTCHQVCGYNLQGVADVDGGGLKIKCA